MKLASVVGEQRSQERRPPLVRCEPGHEVVNGEAVDPVEPAGRDEDREHAEAEGRREARSEQQTAGAPRRSSLLSTTRFIDDARVLCTNRPASLQLFKPPSRPLWAGSTRSPRMNPRTPVTYGLITPARDEEENLRRLGECLIRQTVQPTAWIVVDNGSADDTAGVVRGLAQDHAWIHVSSSPPGSVAQPRGGRSSVPFTLVSPSSRLSTWS